MNRFPNLLLTAVFSAGPAFFFPVYSAEPSGITEQAGDTDMQTDQKGEILFCPSARFAVQRLRDRAGSVPSAVWN